MSLSSVGLLPDAIRALAARQIPRPLREGGPSRAELLENVRARLAAGVLDSSRVSLDAIERALSVRDRPQRGPLADPDLWALELKLADGETEGIVEKIDALERSRGRQPATAYLRARAALLLGSEEPAQLAERVSALAMSMSSFAELELLSAEAWARAGDRKRALAYAHDLAENPQVDPAIRARARAIVQPTRASIPAMPRPTSSVPPFSPAAPSGTSPAVSPSQPPPRSESSPMVAITVGRRGSIAPAPKPAVLDQDEPIAPTPIVSVGVDALKRSSAPPPAVAVPPASAVPFSGQASPSARLSNPALLAAQRASQSALRAPSTPPARPSTRPWMSPPAAFFVETGETVPMSGGAPSTEESPSPGATALRAAETDAGGDDDEAGGDVLVRGGSQPPFRTEPPPPNFPSAPLIPRPDAERVEKAEALSLPPGASTTSEEGELPTSPLEARVYFTHLARELARLYRQRYNVELRTDLRSIEVLQRYLAERFETGDLKNEDDVAEVRLHGAFLSELLARRLGAEWTDLAVTEMGYWAMNVPPNTTIWPIGRVIRFVTMRHRERDLVSYFLELQARAHGLK